MDAFWSLTFHPESGQLVIQARITTTEDAKQFVAMLQHCIDIGLLPEKAGPPTPPPEPHQ
jgi:hypothetical protein